MAKHFMMSELNSTWSRECTLPIKVVTEFFVFVNFLVHSPFWESSTVECRWFSHSCRHWYPIRKATVTKTVFGASLSEPHTSESNGGFFMYYIIYLSAVRTFRKCMLSSINPKYCVHWSVQAKIENDAVALSLHLHRLTEWSSQISAEARRPVMAHKETEPDVLQRQQTRGA